MAKKSQWSNQDVLAATIRQIAVNNGTPNIMPSLSQMKAIPGLATWVQRREGGAKALSVKMNMVMKPSVLPGKKIVGATVQKHATPHRILKGSVVFVHNTRRALPAIVLDNGVVTGSLKVLVLGKKLVKRHVKYGTESDSKFHWCYTHEMPQEKIEIII